MNDKPKTKIKRPKWFREQMVALAEVMREIEPIAKRFGRKSGGALWEIAAGKMAARGFTRSPESIKRKWFRRKHWLADVEAVAPETPPDPDTDTGNGVELPPASVELRDPGPDEPAKPKRTVYRWTDDDREALAQIIERHAEEREWFESQGNVAGFWDRVAFLLKAYGITVSGKAAEAQWRRIRQAEPDDEPADSATLTRIELLLGRLVTAAEKTATRAASIEGWLEAITEQIAAIESKTSTIEAAADMFIAERKTEPERKDNAA